jgi:hypothetical protein
MLALGFTLCRFNDVSFLPSPLYSPRSHLHKIAFAKKQTQKRTQEVFFDGGKNYWTITPRQFNVSRWSVLFSGRETFLEIVQVTAKDDLRPFLKKFFCKFERQKFVNFFNWIFFLRKIKNVSKFLPLMIFLFLFW